MGFLDDVFDECREELQMTPRAKTPKPRKKRSKPRAAAPRRDARVHVAPAAEATPPRIHVAPAAASFFPNIVSGTSAQPVKRFLAFHSLCPCLTKQTLHVAASFQAILMVLRLVVDGRVGSLGWSAAAALARSKTRAMLQLGWQERCTLIAAWE